jgi:hypothetical protein
MGNSLTGWAIVSFLGSLLHGVNYLVMACMVVRRRFYSARSLIFFLEISGHHQAYNVYSYLFYFVLKVLLFQDYVYVLIISCLIEFNVYVCTYTCVCYVCLCVP